jgi:hypothetical protein
MILIGFYIHHNVMEAKKVVQKYQKEHGITSPLTLEEEPKHKMPK